MHQGHNIPWNILSTNFHFVFNDTRFTPPKTDLMLNEDQEMARNALKHFIHKFSQTIRTFSETERRKYPQTLHPLRTGKLFSDNLRDKYPQFLNKNNQDIECWILHPGRLDLANVVKVLLFENQMETLLMLAQHPSTPLAALHHNTRWSWYFDYGFWSVKQSALRAYLFFNTAEATDILDNDQFAKIRGEYTSLFTEIAGPQEFPAHQIPHRQFLRDCGLLEDTSGKPWVPYKTPWTTKDGRINANYARLQEYLKENFALMYRYDVLVRECGLSPEWDVAIASEFPLRGNIKIDWDESQRKRLLL